MDRVNNSNRSALSKGMSALRSMLGGLTSEKIFIVIIWAWTLLGYLVDKYLFNFN